jgi:hypothetical protein
MPTDVSNKAPTRPARGSADAAQQTTAQPVSPDDAKETRVIKRRRWSPQAMLAVLGVLCVVGSAVLWLEHRSLRSSLHVLGAQTAALSRMQTDARAMLTLRAAPQRATDRRKPNEELLSQIARALEQANVPQRLWQDSIPQTPRRTGDGAYQSMSTRLYFEAIALRQLTEFVHRLLAADPTLSLGAIRIADPRGENRPSSAPEDATWNAEVTVTYLIYAPAAG